MYLYTTVQASGNVFVYYGSSEKVMYLYTTVQVRAHLFVNYDSSER